MVLELSGHQSEALANTTRMHSLSSEKLNLLYLQMAELITYYVITALLFIGAPAVFFTIVFMPALMNTKGKWVGYKEYVTYGPSSIND